MNPCPVSEPKFLSNPELGEKQDHKKERICNITTSKYGKDSPEPHSSAIYSMSYTLEKVSLVYREPKCYHAIHIREMDT